MLSSGLINIILITHFYLLTVSLLAWQVWTSYFEGSTTSSVLTEFTGIFKETQDAGVKIISCSEQFQSSITASFYIWLATYQMMADDFEDFSSGISLCCIACFIEKYAPVKVLNGERGFGHRMGKPKKEIKLCNNFLMVYCKFYWYLWVGTAELSICNSFISIKWWIIKWLHKIMNCFKKIMIFF